MTTSEPFIPPGWWMRYELTLRLLLRLNATRRLRDAATLNNRSIAEEAAFRIERSFRDDDVELAARRIIDAGEPDGTPIEPQ